MFRLTSKISIANKGGERFTLDSVKSVEASTGWDSFIDTARVTLPKNLYVRQGIANTIVSFAERTVAAIDPTGQAEKPGQPLFGIGDKIKIELGYDFDYNVVLEGFITNVSATVPIVLECADPMWLLGRIKFGEDVQIDSPSLSGLLKKLHTEFQTSSEVLDYSGLKGGFPELKTIDFKLAKGTEDFKLTNFSIKNKTILSILEELNKEYHVFSNYEINENSLTGVITSRAIVCGNYYNESSSKTSLTGMKSKKFNFQNNVISEELVNKNEEDVKLTIQATNIASNAGSEGNIVTKVGSDKSDAKTKYMEFYKLEGAVGTILKNIADRRLKTIRYTGYAGCFVTFGKPFVKHGDTIELIDNYVKDRNGKFKVRQVEYSFGDGGFKQKIYPHIKVK